MKQLYRLVLKHVERAPFPCVVYIRESMLKDLNDSMVARNRPAWWRWIANVYYRHVRLTNYDVDHMLDLLTCMKCVAYDGESAQKWKERLEKEAKTGDDKPKAGPHHQHYYRVLGFGRRYIGT